MDRRDYIGQVVDGKYKLLDLLGEGGMAAVYLAEHVILHKQVALKVLRFEQVKDETSLKRFYREAQASTAIGHPAIINIFDVGHAPWGEPYLVMEYLRGESLGTLLERVGTLPLAEAAAIACPLLEAIGAAHQAGIVHRDLKPENIFLAKSRSGGAEVKIIDFGVSKFTRQAGDFTQLTQLGSLVGTPHYMPIEQLLGQEIDHRADLYAVGVVLYEMLTGRRPFEAPNYTAVLGRIMSQQMTPPAQANPAFPRQAEPLILRAMAKDAKDRYQSASAMLAAVSALASDDLRQQGARTMATRISDAFVGLGTLGRAQRQQAASVDTLDALMAAPRPTFSQSYPPSKGDSTAKVSRGSSLDAWAKSETGLRLRPRRVGLIVTSVLLASTLIAGGIITAVLWAEGSQRRDASTVPASAAPLSLPQANSQPPVAPAPPPTNAPRVDSVEIRLLDLPLGAKVVFDGGVVGDNPFRVRKRTDSVLLRIEATGFNDFELSVIPEQDLAIVAQLTPRPESGSAAPSSRRRHRSNDEDAAPDTASAPAPPLENPDPAPPTEEDYRLRD